jgi:hypothetical protein
MVKKNNTLKYSIAAVGLLAVGGAIGHMAFPTHVETEKTVEVVKEVPVDKIVYVDKMVEVEVPVEVVKEVIVESENLEMVLEHMHENDGNVDYLVDDLEDDELSQIVDRISLVNEVKQFALDGVKKDLAEEMDGMVVNGTTLDEDDVERLRLDDEPEEITFADYDFDDKDFTVEVTGRFEHDDVKYKFTTDVKIKDGEYDELDNIVVTLA